MNVAFLSALAPNFQHPLFQRKTDIYFAISVIAEKNVPLDRFVIAPDQSEGVVLVRSGK